MDPLATCTSCGVILSKAQAARVPAPTSLAERASTLLLVDTRSDPASLIGRGLLLLLLLRWTWVFASSSIASNAPGRSFLHLINLPFHEAGHIIFIPLGGFMMSLGGSLTQVMLPLVLAIVFLTRHRDPFGAAATWWWCGQNLIDLAPYINDARALQLVLLGGKTGAEVEGHDWERILMTLGWLHLDNTLARLAQVTGVLIMLSAIAWAIVLLMRHWQRSKDPALANAFE